MRIVDHRGASVRRTRRRTLAAFGLTLTNSTSIVVRGILGRLDAEDFARVIPRWSRQVFDVSQTTLEVRGREHVPDTPCVLLSNHRSLLDVPAIVLAFPGRVSFVAKEELRSVPMFGRAMARYGIIFVDRAHRERAIAQLAAAGEALRAGTSVWIAAEGGRSKGVGLGELKKGPFHVALQLAVPIVPTWIEGTERVLPSGALRSVTGQTVAVRFGPPLPTEGVTRGSLGALMQQARSALLALADP